jgi:hypothetical protein
VLADDGDAPPAEEDASSPDKDAPPPERELLIDRGQQLIERALAAKAASSSLTDPLPGKCPEPGAGKSALLTAEESSSPNPVTYSLEPLDVSAPQNPPNSTLFVIIFGQVTQAEVAASMERLFGEMQGFNSVLETFKSGNRAKIDFESTEAATAAMVKFQGHRLHPDAVGLKIDYDKDKGTNVYRAGVACKRKQEDKQRKQLPPIQRPKSDDYRCAVCGTQAIRTSGVLLSDLPTRSTDSAIVVDENMQLEELLLDCADEPVLIRRPKGIERQYHLCCRSCRKVIAYRATQTAQSFLYVLQGSVVDSITHGASFRFQAKSLTPLPRRVITGDTRSRSRGGKKQQEKKDALNRRNASTNEEDAVESIEPEGAQ